MRILHVITRLIVGGAQENTLLTCEGLHQRGHAVTLLVGPTEGPEGSLMERARDGGYEVRVTPHLVRNPNAWHDAAAYGAIKQAIREIRPEVVHTHSSKAGIVGRAASWNSRPRPVTVHTIHGLPFHPHQNKVVNGAWIFLERWAARRCHKIICVADAMTRQALAAGVGHAGQFVTVYSGMEVEPFLKPRESGEQIRQRLEIPQDRLVLGTIARLQPLKGHDDLLAIAGRLFEQSAGIGGGAHFMWVGNGIFRERFEKIISANGWKDRFTFTGLVKPEEVPELLPAMDIVVHPSYREGLARALPQALLAEVPVVSYDCDGAGEVCIPGETGELAATGDREALLQAILAVVKNTGRKTLGQRGRAICLQQFAAAVMVERIEKIYGELVERGR